MIGRIAAAIAERLRRLRYFLADLGYLLGRPFRGVGGRLSGSWQSVSPENRRRAAVALTALAVIALAVFVVGPNLPCGAPGGDACAPDDNAMALVPAEALAYAHVNLEQGSDQYDRAVGVANRTPLLTTQVLGRLLPLFLGASGAPPDFGQDIQPWLGGEIALAVVPGESGTQEVEMLEVADEAGARDYEGSIEAGAPDPTKYQGIDLREDDRGLATAIVNGFLVIGSSQGVRSVIDVATGADGAGSLGDDDVAGQALDALPNERFADAYLSTEGIDSLLGLSNGPLASLEPLVDSGDSDGAAFALTAEADGFRFATRSLLDPDRSKDAGGFFAAFDSFQPELPSELAPDTLAYFGLGNAKDTIGKLLQQATIRAPGIAAGFTDLIARLRKEAGVDIASELLPALGGEGALAVAPRPKAPSASSAQGAQQVPGVGVEPNPPETIQGGQPDVPYVEFLAGNVDESAARDALARLQKPLAGTVDPTLGNPVFEEKTFGHVTAEVLQRSAADVLAYAAFDSKLVIANDTAPIERLEGNADEGLGGSDAYRAGTEGLAQDPSFIAYLDLSGLVEAASRLGAGGETPFATFAGDLRKLETFGLTVSQNGDELSSDSLIRIAP